MAHVAINPYQPKTTHYVDENFMPFINNVSTSTLRELSRVSNERISVETALIAFKDLEYRREFNRRYGLKRRYYRFWITQFESRNAMHADRLARARADRLAGRRVRAIAGD